MPLERLSLQRTRLIRLVCVLFAASSFVLGGWMVIDPAAAWASMSVGVAEHPFVPALYGGAIVGEGAMFSLCAIWPSRYLVFFQYLVIYKAMACLAGSAVLLGMKPAPIGGWLVIGGWAIAGTTAAMIYPWKRWRKVEADHGAA